MLDKFTCPSCEREEETLCHVLWRCPAVVDVWAEEGSPMQKWAYGEEYIGVVWRKMAEKLNEEELGLVATVLRNVWLRRNKLVFENGFFNPKAIFTQAKHSIEENQSAQGNSRATSSSRTTNNSRGERELAKWKAPREGVVKVNWDATYDEKNMMMGASVIIRDATGDVLVSLCLKKNTC